MKRFALVLVIMSMALSTVWSQEEIPIPPKRSRSAKVGAFGGFTPGWLSLDVKPINDFLVPAGGASLKDEGVFLYGGAGAAYIMFLPNFRVGGVGMGGQISSTRFDPVTRVRRDAELHVGLAGVTIEYVIPIAERLDVAIGGMLGGGGIVLTLHQAVEGTRTWQEIWANYHSGNYQTGGQISNITQKLDGSYFVWVPSVNVEYALLGWVGLRLGVSYVGMSSPSWQIDDRDELIGVPTSVSGKGVMINGGILVGTF